MVDYGSGPSSADLHPAQGHDACCNMIMVETSELLVLVLVSLLSLLLLLLLLLLQ